MSDKLVSWLRTVCPFAWSLLVGWLVARGLPHELTDWLSGLGVQVTNFVVAGVLYALARWVEPHLPSWAVAVFFGSSKTPTYPQAASGAPTPAPAKE